MGFLSRAKNILKGRPFSRERYRSGVVSLEEEGSVNRGFDTDRLFELLRKTPEVLSLQQAIVDDVIGNGYRFEYIGESKGTQAKKDARDFYESHAKEEFANTIMDLLTAGDGYMYKNMTLPRDAKSHIVEKYGDRFEDKSFAEQVATSIVDDVVDEKSHGFGEPEKVEHVPATTVEHKINKYGDILQFDQSVDGGHSTKIPPEKMIHFSYLSVNGGTYNFSPMRSIVSELQILANSKDHNGKIHDNAAIVNKLYKLPEDGPNSQNYKHLKKTIQKFSELEDKHKDLVLTGDIEVEDLNSIGEDMEFRSLAEYITKVIVMAWGVPPTRIGMNVSENSGARVTSLTHQGYFKRIKRLQDKWVNRLNQELWEPHFNCRMIMEEPDVQTEIKEAEKDLRQTDVALKRMATGMMDRSSAMDYLGIEKEDVADLEDEQDKAVMELAAQIQSGRNQTLSELEVFGGRAEEEMREDQEQAQEDNITQNPSGGN